MSIRKGNTVISGSVIVENTLDSENTTTALSAKQGKILNDKAIPSGGTKDQVLVKVSDADYDFAWVDAKIGGGGGDTIPVGAIFPYPSHKMPYGYLECNGQTFDKETYPTLGRICDENFGFKWQYATQWNSYDDRWYSAMPFWCNLSALTIGDEYNISIAGKQYKQELKHMTDDPEDIGLVDVYYFGNLYLMNSEFEDTGESFIWECVVPRNSEAPMPPYFNQIAGIEFPSEEYVKLSIDTTKTFMLLNSEESGGGLVTSYFPYFNFFKEDEYYDIKFNNVLYHSKCVSCSGYPMKFIGNMSLFETGWDDTGEPFLLGIQVNSEDINSVILYCETTLTDLCIPIEFVMDENVSFLPDLTGLTIAGYRPEDQFFGTIGGVVGSLYHNHYINGTTLTINQIPSHSHTTGISGSVAGTMSSGSNSAQVSHDQTKGVQTTTTGGGQSHNHSEDSELSLQPTMTLVWIVKAEEMTPIDAIVEDTLGSNSATNALSAKQGKILNQKAIPKGGIMGQVLGKKSDNDNDVRWMDMREGVDYTPIGTISPWGGVEAPVGYAICDGRRINKNNYPEYAEKFGFQYTPGLFLTTYLSSGDSINTASMSEPYFSSFQDGEYYDFFYDGKLMHEQYKQINEQYGGWGNFKWLDSSLDTGEDYGIVFMPSYSGPPGIYSTKAGIHKAYFPFIMGYGNTAHSTVYDIYDEEHFIVWDNVYKPGDIMSVDIINPENLNILDSIQGIWKSYIAYYDDEEYEIRYVGNLYLYDSTFPNTGESYLFFNEREPWNPGDESWLKFSVSESSPYFNYTVFYNFHLPTLESSYQYTFTPDLRHRVIGGYDKSEDNYYFNMLGATIGGFTHYHDTQSHTLTTNEIPSHTHKPYKWVQNGNYVAANREAASIQMGTATAGQNIGNGTLTDMTTTTVSGTDIIEKVGGGQSHSHGSTHSNSSIQPTYIMNWIIKIEKLSRGDIINNSKIINVFSPSMEYNVGDIVLHNKTLYRCKKAITKPGEWTGLDRTVYRNLRVGDTLNGKTIQFNWPTYFSAESMYPIFIGAEGSGAPIMGLMPYDEGLYVMTTITDFPSGSPVYSDPLIGYTLDDSTDPGEYWVDWSVPQITEVTYSNNIPGSVVMIAPDFENAFKIAEEVEGNWEIYSDPTVYKLQDQNLLFSLQHALQSESEIYSLTPESLGWSGVEEIIAACQDYDNNLYVDAFEHILRLDVGENVGETTYIITIPDNTLTLLIDDEPVQITYHGYFFIVTGGQFGDRANFQIFKKTFETPKATQNSIGGIQLYFDSNNNTLYMSNDGTVPGPWTWFLLPNAGMSQIIEGTTWRNWVNGEGPEEERETFQFEYQEDVSKSYIIDMMNGQYVGYNGEFATPDDVIIPEVQYEYLTLGPTVSTFTVTSRGMLPTDPTKTDTCAFEEGMTWREFVDSSYGTYWDIGDMGGTIFLTYNNDDTGCYGALYDEDLDSPIVADTDYMLV